MANFKNLFLSFFLVVALGLALVHASEARGPKITSKVTIPPRAFLPACGRNVNSLTSLGLFRY